MWLNDGSVYHSGMGKEKADNLLRGWEISTEQLDWEIEDLKGIISRYGHVYGATNDLWVAELITRRMISNRYVAYSMLSSLEKFGL